MRLPSLQPIGWRPVRLLVGLGLWIGVGAGGVGAAPALKQRLGPQYEGRGVVYMRVDRATGRSYVGQSRDAHTYDRRQQDHERVNGRAYDFHELARPHADALDLVEQRFIEKARAGTPPDQPIENKRNQMRPERYEREARARRRETGAERMQRREREAARARERREARVREKEGLLRHFR